jgi:hypothetical protein
VVVTVYARHPGRCSQSKVPALNGLNILATVTFSTSKRNLIRTLRILPRERKFSCPVLQVACTAQALV